MLVESLQQLRRIETAAPHIIITVGKNSSRSILFVQFKPSIYVWNLEGKYVHLYIHIVKGFKFQNLSVFRLFLLLTSIINIHNRSHKQHFIMSWDLWLNKCIVYSPQMAVMQKQWWCHSGLCHIGICLIPPPISTSTLLQDATSYFCRSWKQLTKLSPLEKICWHSSTAVWARILKWELLNGKTLSTLFRTE